MKVTQYISGKFHYVKYARFLERMVNLRFIFSGKPIEKVCDSQVNCWAFYTSLQVLVRVLPGKFFSTALRISYFLWERSVTRELKKDIDVDVFHFLCHGFTGEKILKMRGGSVLLGHVVNAHPGLQVELVKESYRSAGMKYPEDLSREFVDQRIVDEVRLSDYILSPSVFVTSSYVEHGFDPKKFITLNYGLESSLKKQNLRAEKVFGVGEVVKIICVGQIIPRKGQYLLVDTLSKLESEGYKFELVLVGYPDAEYISKINSLGFRYKHIPHMPNKQLLSYLEEFDLFVLPSYEDGFAVAVTEAMSAELPVIISDAVGAADLLVDKKHSVFVAGSVLSLKDKILGFLVGNYSETLSEHYDWSGYSKLLVKVYEKVVSDANPS